MNKDLKIAAPWSQLALFLCLFGGAFMVYGMLASMLMKMMGLSVLNLSPDQIDWSNPKIVNTLKALQALATLVIFLLPAYAFTRLVFLRSFARNLGFRAADRPNMYVLSVIVMMLSLPLVFWLGELNQSVPLPEWMSSLENDVSKQLEAFLKYRGPAGVFLNLVIIALLPAIGEELCFRSVMQRIIIQLSGNAWAGILITAFLFSALHLQFEGFLPRMFLGGILGVLYWYSGSIWTAILAHFTNNAVQVLFVSYFPQYIKENPSIPLLLVVASSVSVGAVIMYYKNESRQTFTRVYRSDGTDTNLPYSA